MNEKTRTIHTGLYGEQAFEALKSVSGQLSDGMWENSPGYDKYWTNFNVNRADDGEVVFLVNTDSHTLWCKRYLENPFAAMDEKQFKEWYARKLKAIITQEFKDHNKHDQWHRRNTEYNSIYLGHDPAYGTKYGPAVTVADIYCVYDALRGRPIGITKYEVSTICRVFGNKKTDEEIAQAKSLREKKNAIQSKYIAIYQAHKDGFEKAKTAAIESLTKEYDEKLAKLREAEKAELAANGIVA